MTWTDEQLKEALLSTSLYRDEYVLSLDVMDDSNQLLGSGVVIVPSIYVVDPAAADLVARAAHEIHRRLQKERKNAQSL